MRECMGRTSSYSIFRVALKLFKTSFLLLIDAARENAASYVLHHTSYGDEVDNTLRVEWSRYLRRYLDIHSRVNIHCAVFVSYFDSQRCLEYAIHFDVSPTNAPGPGILVQGEGRFCFSG